MKKNKSKFSLSKEAFTPLYNHALIEPEVWIEYLRTRNGVYVSGANGITPKGVFVRTRKDEATGEIVLEWLV